jgi:hypothetical protein
VRSLLSLPPEAAAGVAGLALQLQEQRLVADVGRDGHDLGIAQPDELGVDHRLAGPDVGEQPAVAVVRLHVQLEAHALALDQAAVHRERLAAAGLLALARMVELGGVHADVADLLDTLADPHVHGVAVHDAEHGRLQRRRGVSRGRRDRQPEREQHQRTQHAPTVSRPGA